MHTLHTRGSLWLPFFIPWMFSWGASWKWRFNWEEQKQNLNSCSPFGKALLRIILPLWLPLPFLFRLFLYSRFSLIRPAAWEKLILPPQKFGFDGSDAGCFRMGKRSPWESCLSSQTPLHSQLFRLSLKELRSTSQWERKSDLEILIQYRKAIKTYSVLLFKGQIIKSFLMSSLQKINK